MLESSGDVGRANATAQGADFVVLVVDNAKDGGAEGLDRETIGLSAAQKEVRCHCGLGTARSSA